MIIHNLKDFHGLNRFPIQTAVRLKRSSAERREDKAVGMPEVDR